MIEQERIIKTLRTAMTLKDDGADESAVSAVFSTFEVVDSDKDVVLATAFTHGQEVPMTWSHDWTAPIGKGRILVEPAQAVFDGAFFLKTSWGRDAYESVKAMGSLQEWSWGFKLLEATQEIWNGEPVRVIRKADVYEVSPVLVGSSIGTFTRDIKAGQTYAEQVERALAVLSAISERSRSLADLRLKEGRVLSDANRKRLASLKEALEAVGSDIADLLESTAPPEKGANLALFAAYQRTLARLNGVAA